jgi:hypothetical protein
LLLVFATIAVNTIIVAQPMITHGTQGLLLLVWCRRGGSDMPAVAVADENAIAAATVTAISFTLVISPDPSIARVPIQFSIAQKYCIQSTGRHPPFV